MQNRSYRPQVSDNGRNAYADNMDMDNGLVIDGNTALNGEQIL